MILEEKNKHHKVLEKKLKEAEEQLNQARIELEKEKEKNKISIKNTETHSSELFNPLDFHNKKLIKLIETFLCNTTVSEFLKILNDLVNKYLDSSDLNLTKNNISETLYTTNSTTLFLIELKETWSNIQHIKKDQNISNN
jgi:hypothetical protein